MRAEQTRYLVPGWGVGELWTLDELVLAHDFTFAADAGVDVRAVRARPPKGEHGPPTGTVPADSPHMGYGFVPSPRQGIRAPTWPTAELTEPPARRGLGPHDLARRLSAFLEGDDVRLDDVPLDLASSTRFQHAVATSLRVVPSGEVVSYGELAALAGYPGAGRAVGTFCARNRFMFLLPCHRVVGAGGIGGYGSAGIGVKRRLLALEGVVL